MVDFLSPSERSERMSRIRSSNTAPEVALRRAMHAIGFRFRLHSKGLPGKPDIVLPRHKTVIFVHGCFWHRHSGCKIATTPKTNTEFWVEKFDRNVVRDARTREQLEGLGWRVMNRTGFAGELHRVCRRLILVGYAAIGSVSGAA